MIVNNNFYANVGKVVNRQDTPILNKPENAAKGTFDEILKSKVNEGSEIKFSKHAQMRLQMRNINLSEAQKERISRAVQKAEEKGVRESLVLVDDMAFVVNVRSKTVITAVNSNELKDNVFTNIDGAVFT
ncbi:MAG TPA: TIGR02530 family flagellar biosynthesis protein [Acetivibrio sp.]|jgi:flagellar operon protein|nr:flagellar biosynthesis protein [Clostridium sp.]HOQ37740.1 TIGR02530 family flagellar biosynthesis protein [Acetivibrio sp.]HPT90700.1 TIGR02530 family flagellar biosynthesis protein [Acetivibrio sp.]HQA57035.1 TIGR02530 family flagellar biosynthesis protein [Acetivibrio sp.]